MTLRTVSILLIAFLLAVGGFAGTAFAGEKAGGVNATSGCDQLQDNTISGEILVWMHDPAAHGFAVVLTYHKSGDTFEAVLLGDSGCSWGNWYLYSTGLSVSQGGTASIAIFDDETGAKVGGDSFRALFGNGF